jgi:ERCC4-type nuclease
VPDAKWLEPLYVDRRVGSIDLYPLLIQRDLPAEVTTLAYGDCCFVGSGPSGVELIGVERKRISDLAHSLTGERFQGHQLPGLLEAYRWRWLVVEGSYRTGATGFIELPRTGGWVPLVPTLRGDGLARWLLTLALRGGVQVVRTRDPNETADFLHALYGWWQKSWVDHGGHFAVGVQADPSLFIRSRLVRRWAKELPGIGVEKSALVDRTFATCEEMVQAPEALWQTIPGIGPTLAGRIVKLIRTREG